MKLDQHVVFLNSHALQQVQTQLIPCLSDPSLMSDVYNLFLDAHNYLSITQAFNSKIRLIFWVMVESFRSYLIFILKVVEYLVTFASWICIYFLFLKTRNYRLSIPMCKIRKSISLGKSVLWSTRYVCVGFYYV